MADFLDDSFGQNTPDINLDEFVKAPNQSTTIPPEGAVRNRAATTALLSGNPDEAVNRYRQMLFEAQQGYSTTQEMLQKDIHQQVDQLDQKQIVAILADNTVPFDVKQRVVQGYKVSDVLKDNATTLHSNLLSAGSDGESRDQENARISTADAIAETQRARSERQGLVNAHIASLQSRNAPSALFDALASVVPFVTNVATAKVAKQVAEATGEKFNLWDAIKAGVDVGGTNLKIRDKIARMSPPEQIAFTKKLVDAIGSNSSILFGTDNQYLQFQAFDNLFLSGYNDQNAALDTIGTILDVVGVGWTGKSGKTAKSAAQEAAAGAGTAEKATANTRATPGRGPAPDVEDVNFNEVQRASWELVDDTPVNPFPKALPNGQKRLPYDDGPKRIEANYPVRSENPASPFEIAQNSNPQQARALFEAQFKADSEEAANAFSGTSKQQAVSNSIYPQATTETGAVVSKTPDIQRNLRAPNVPDELVDMVHNTGAIYYSKAEKARARANIVNDFSNADGMTMNEAMSSFRVSGGRVFVEAVYGANDGSWSTARDAITQAKYALKDYGIADENLEILQKQGIDHVPVKLEDVADIPGDYLVRVKTPYEFTSKDIGNFDKLTTRFNWLDRVPELVTSRKGSATRYMFDAASALDPLISGAASVATDATARARKVMVGYASEYSDKYVKLSDIQKARVDDYIREANFNNIPYDQADLLARGFSGDEITTLKAWRDFWDGHYYLENYDLVRSLRNRNFQVFENSQHTLFARRIEKNINKAKVYDAQQDIVRTLSRDEMDDLYNKGGYFAVFRRPIDFNGQVAEQMLVRNTPNEYLRGIRDGDRVLNYREGYYQLQYTAPKFVDEIERDAAGNITSKRTVAVAGDTKEAQFFADRTAKNTGKEYQIRNDNKTVSKDSDEYWDLMQAGGRIAQRHRGKLLEDASGLNHLGDGSYIMHPVESAQRAASSIAGRTMTRNMLDTAKARIMDQFPDAFPSNGMGGRKWPSDVKDVGDTKGLNSKYSADARSNWEYINYLENGYLNTIDDTFKMVLRSIAEHAGEKGWTSVERISGKAAEHEWATLSTSAKGFIFKAYIATNPLRQLIVQPHQVARTFVYNPIGWLNGNIEKYFLSYGYAKTNLPFKPSADVHEFIKFIDDFGALDAVDTNNLVRGTLREAANSSNRVVRAANKPFEVAQTYGFDLGEQANLLGHAAAVFDRYKRLGKDLSDLTVRDEAYSEIRALSYDMNFAGDLPYNQTSPSVALQFLQVPHKAMLQVSNRRIPAADRARMLIGDLIMWGTPAATISTIVGGNILPDDPETRKMLTDGIEGVLVNKMLSEQTGEETDIDFSSLAPYNMDGWAKAGAALWTGGTWALITNSPAGQIFLKDGGRTQNAIYAMGRYFNGFFDNETKPETFTSMASEVMKISSAWSNGVKAKVMLNTGKVLDQYGNAIDPSVSHAEAWAQALGFGTNDSRLYYELSQKWNKDIKAQKADVEQVVNDIFRYYARNLQDENTNFEFVTGVTGLALQAFKDNPQAQQLAAQAIRQRLRTEDSNLVYLMMKRAGIPDSTSMRDDIRRAPVTEDVRQEMNKRYTDAENAKAEIKQYNKE